MYVPKPYQVNETWSTELIRRHPLAILVTNGPEVPLATHLPTVFPPHERQLLDAGEPLVGRTLFGHLNRLNPHWTALQSADPSILIFHGPNTYVSPTVYQVTPAAPTWNFTSVHMRGSLRPITERDITLQIVRWTVEAFEAEFGASWDMRPSLGYFERIVAGVGAFGFEIESVDSMFKLSQDQPVEVYERVVQSFAASDSRSKEEIATLMCRIHSTNNG